MDLGTIAVGPEENGSFLMVGVRGVIEAIVGGVAPALPMLEQTATKADIAATVKRHFFTFFRLF
ncbi:hypothetical protein N234_34630 [Ralstonia pickettii DTP0602]|nr:hypothetical protein N234_34630 [Ralstonia pickettii DTP0602]